MTGLRILFRTDADAAMGTGHVMRCLALAEALRDLGHDCHFLCAPLPPALARRLGDEGITLHSLENLPSRPDGGAPDTLARQTLYMVSAIDARALVVDGYHFAADWRRHLHEACRGAGRTVLALDDAATGPVAHADLVLNPAAAERGDLPDCLFGPRYALLRRDIRRAALTAPPLAMRRHILITFGGSDPRALTVPVTAALDKALADMPSEAVTLSVVIGGAVPDGDAVAASLALVGDRVEGHRDVRDMGELMAQAGLAVSAGGGTLGELAALAVPTVVATVADNQLAGSAAAARAGWCMAMDGTRPEAPDRIARTACDLWRDLARREAMAARAAGVVDGQGALRVARYLVETASRFA